MFRMYGRIVQILRYQSTSTDGREPITHYAPDVPDTMAEALKIRDMGQTSYQSLLKRQEQQAPEALHAASADLMDLIVDQEVRLTMLDLGVTEGGEI